jgi:hypothetical protein
LLKKTLQIRIRNYPNEFHNGSWSMVNGFYGLGLLSKEKKREASEVLEAINAANAVDNYSFMKTSTVKQSSQTECLLRLERSSDCDVASV